MPQFSKYHEVFIAFDRNSRTLANRQNIKNLGRTLFSALFVNEFFVTITANVYTKFVITNKKSYNQNVIMCTHTYKHIYIYVSLYTCVRARACRTWDSAVSSNGYWLYRRFTVLA